MARNIIEIVETKTGWLDLQPPAWVKTMTPPSNETTTMIMILIIVWLILHELRLMCETLLKPQLQPPTPSPSPTPTPPRTPSKEPPSPAAEEVPFSSGFRKFLFMKNPLRRRRSPTPPRFDRAAWENVVPPPPPPPREESSDPPWHVPANERCPEAAPYHRRSAEDRSSGADRSTGDVRFRQYPPEQSEEYIRHWRPNVNIVEGYHDRPAPQTRVEGVTDCAHHYAEKHRNQHGFNYHCLKCLRKIYQGWGGFEKTLPMKDRRHCLQSPSLFEDETPDSDWGSWQDQVQKDQ